MHVRTIHNNTFYDLRFYQGQEYTCVCVGIILFSGSFLKLYFSLFLVYVYDVLPRRLSVHCPRGAHRHQKWASGPLEPESQTVVSYRVGAEGQTWVLLKGIQHS